MKKYMNDELSLLREALEQVGAKALQYIDFICGVSMGWLLTQIAV